MERPQDESASYLLAAPLLAQASIGPGLIIAILLGVLVLSAILYFLLRSATDDKKMSEEERAQLEEADEPTADLLEEREEVEEEVEDYEDMSLAEIKKAKMAKVSTKGKRKTAGEATEESREAHEEEVAEAPDVDEEEDEAAEAEEEEVAEAEEPVEEAEEAAEAEEEADEEEEVAEEEEEDDEEAEEEEAAETDEEEEEADEEADEEEAADEEADEGEAAEEDEEAEEEEDEEDEEKDDGDTGGGFGLPTPGELSEVSEVEEEEAAEEEEEAEEADEEEEAADEEQEESEEDEDEAAEAEEETEEEAGDAEKRADQDEEEEEKEEASDDEEEEEKEEASEEEDEDEKEEASDDEDEEEEEEETADEEETVDEEETAEEEETADEDEPDEKEARGRPDEAEASDEEATPRSYEEGLEKTRSGFISQLSDLFTGEVLDEETVEEIEAVLFQADIGPRVAQDIIAAIEEKLTEEDVENPKKLWGFIRHYTRELLQTHEEPLDTDQEKPYVVLVVGVNGVGKTTTIGKMASRFKREGKSVLLVAGDTYRAAAVDQLGIWAERTGLPMHSGEEGADPASVVYGGIERAVEEDFDVVICDTSGRLHTNVNLMEELAKMERVAGKAKEGAPHEVNLVLDANTGQNAIRQAEKFDEALDVTGFTLTKFDGTARGGVILGICKRFDAPIRYVGFGERVVDLREFHADEFVEALFM